MMFSSVVFPEPDAPTTDTRSPGATSKSTARRARTGTSAPKLRLTFSSRTRGVISAARPWPGLEPDHHVVPGRHGGLLLRRDADETGRGQCRADRHEVAPAVLRPLHPGPSVGSDGDGRDRHRQ